MRILTNHLGYDPHAPKRVVIQGDIEDQVQACSLINVATGKQMLYQEPIRMGTVPKWKDWYFWHFDFTPVTTEGTYMIECVASFDLGATKEKVFSAPFRIQENLLERGALSDVTAYFKSMRCSGANDRHDRKVKFEGNPGLKPVDMHGGWYDATADYGKHLSHLCFSTYFNPQQLPLVAWSLFQSIRELKRKADPNYRQLLRRMIDEGLSGADYLVRAHKPGGSFYITVSGFGPEKRPQDRRLSPAMRGFRLADPLKKDAYAPTARATQESTYESSLRSGAGVAIAALAAAAACGERGEMLPHVYLQTAQEAFEYLEAHNPELTDNGEENIVDDYCALLAAVELYKATKAVSNRGRGEGEVDRAAHYRAAAAQRANLLLSRLVPGSSRTAGDGYANYWRADDASRPFFHAADAGFPVVALAAYLSIASHDEEPRLLETMRRSLKAEIQRTNEVFNPFGLARQLVQNRAGVKRVGFFFPHDTETAPWWQGENARLASLAAAARLAAPHFAQDKILFHQLTVYAQDQLNWILGLNPYDACMLHGSGRNNPEYLFFDAWEYKNLPGGIVNGITGGFFNEDGEGIDFMLPQSDTGQDSDWRWTEQWLPHAAWFLLAAAAR